MTKTNLIGGMMTLLTGSLEYFILIKKINGFFPLKDLSQWGGWNSHYTLTTPPMGKKAILITKPKPNSEINVISNDQKGGQNAGQINNNSH